MKYQLQIDSQLALLSSYCTTKRLRKTRNRRLRLGHSLEKLIFGWNDSEGRTKEEVAEVLEALADRLEAEYTSYIHDIIRRAVRVPRQWSSRVMDDELAETR